MGRAVNTLISGNANYPMIIEIVDERENIEKILPFLEKNATHALVLVEEATYMVTDYMREQGYKGFRSIENKGVVPSYIKKQLND